jgi:hypothetical protein
MGELSQTPMGGGSRPFKAKMRTTESMAAAGHRPYTTGPDIKCPYCDEPIPRRGCCKGIGFSSERKGENQISANSRWHAVRNPPTLPQHCHPQSDHLHPPYSPAPLRHHIPANDRGQSGHRGESLVGERGHQASQAGVQSFGRAQAFRGPEERHRSCELHWKVKQVPSVLHVLYLYLDAAFLSSHNLQSAVFYSVLTKPTSCLARQQLCDQQRLLSNLYFYCCPGKCQVKGPHLVRFPCSSCCIPISLFPTQEAAQDLTSHDLLFSPFPTQEAAGISRA